MQSLQPPLPEYMTPDLLRQLFSDDFKTQVLAARRMAPEDKFRAGPDLFDLACWHLRWAAQILCPRASTEERETLMRQFLTIAHQLDDAGAKPPQ